MSQNPQIFLVGGAVRDHLLGIESKDRDYVVVGSDAASLLAQGYQQVGADFPVFLHPETGEEYALARTERKVGSGYHGFEVVCDTSVTLEDDLARRDLTINSMAMTDNLQIIDPFGGCNDLRDGVLRHTSVAFAEDPLRVLRLARFAARYNFTVASETIKLAKSLVEAGELDHLTPERVWKELNRAVREPYGIRFFQVLTEVGAMETKMLKQLFGTMNMFRAANVLMLARDFQANEHIIIAMLGQLDQLKAHELKEDGHAHWLASLRAMAKSMLKTHDANALLSFLEKAKLIQDNAKVADFEQLLRLMELTGEVMDGTSAVFEAARLAVKPINADDLVDVFKGPEIGKALRAKRLKALVHALQHTNT